MLGFDHRERRLRTFRLLSFVVVPGVSLSVLASCMSYSARGLALA